MTLTLSSRNNGNENKEDKTVRSSCHKFVPNLFTPSKCQDCFRQKSSHSAQALAENRLCRKVCKCGFLFVAPTDLDFTNPAHRSRRWQRRWFVLYDDGELTYSLDENIDTVPQGMVDMTEVVEVTNVATFTSHDFSMMIKDPSQEYFIKGVNKEEIKWWFDVLAMYPRSRRFTKHHRSQQQHKLRSRTLPNNALSDDQLAALQMMSVSREDYPVSKTATIVPATRNLSSLFPATLEDSSANANNARSAGLLETTDQVNEVPASSNLNKMDTTPSDVSKMSEQQQQQQQNGRNNGGARRMTTQVTQPVEREPIIVTRRIMPEYPQLRSRNGDETLSDGGNHDEQTDSQTDNLTDDTDSSTDSEEVFGVKKLCGNSRKATSQATSATSRQRFVFTGLSSKDIEDLKQLQRIMNKKDSLSSRSSSTSSFSYGATKNLLRSVPTPSDNTYKFDHPKSPPINRTIISRTKERSRVRSKSPKLDRPIAPPVEIERSLDAVKKSDMRTDQSTQISLDVRHYEIMVSNLEKRLLDREQLVRDLSQKLEASKLTISQEAAEKDKFIDMSQKQLEKNRKDSKMLISNLEMSTSLNHKYEKRLQTLLEKVALKDGVESKYEAQCNRIQELEKLMSDLNISSNDAISRRDELLAASRREVEKLSKKLSETETLLMGALNEKYLNSSGVGKEEVGKSSPGKCDDSLNQLATKFLNSLKEIRQLSQEKSSLETRLSVCQTELRTKNDHEECHLTQDALHVEINSLQARLQKQTEGHKDKTEMMKKLADDLDSLKKGENLAGELKNVKMVCQRKVEQCQKMILDLKKSHQTEMETLRAKKDEELAEEVKATKAALEIIGRAHQEQLQFEMTRMAQVYFAKAESAQDAGPVLLSDHNFSGNCSSPDERRDDSDSALESEHKLQEMSERYHRILSDLNLNLMQDESK